MIFKTRDKVDKTNSLNVYIDQVKLKHVETTTFLGVIIDNRLSWSQHINYIKIRLRKVLGFYVKLGNFCTQLL